MPVARRCGGGVTRALWWRLLRGLVGDGYTVRDIGLMLGLSPQRVSQIAHEVAEGRRRASLPQAG